MTDHTDNTAPESVFLDMDVYGEWGLSSMFRRDESETQYTRADLVASTIADAERRGRDAGLRKAAEICRHEVGYRTDQADTSDPGIQRDRWVAGRIAVEICLDNILALRNSPAEPSDTVATVTDDMVEKATMALLGHREDTSPGVDWDVCRTWRVNDVRALMRGALTVALAGASK